MTTLILTQSQPLCLEFVTLNPYKNMPEAVSFYHGNQDNIDSWLLWTDRLFERKGESVGNQRQEKMNSLQSSPVPFEVLEKD